MIEFHVSFFSQVRAELSASAVGNMAFGTVHFRQIERCRSANWITKSLCISNQLLD